ADGGATAPDLADTAPTSEQPTATTAEDAPGAELAPDTERAPARRAGRIPPALRGAASDVRRWTVDTGLPAATVIGRVTARHGSYATVGTWELARRGWARLTFGDLNEAIRAARAAGDLGQVAELEARKQASADARMARVKTLLQAASKTPKVLGMFSAGLLALLTVAGMVAQIRPGGTTFTGVWAGFGDALATGADWALWAGTMLPWLALAGLGVIGVAGYALGRSTGRAPQWAQSGAAAPSQAVVIDETTIAQALGTLGIKAINDHLKQGLPLQYTAMPHRTTNEDGEKDVGITAQVRLPGGTAASEVIKQSTKLAAALARASVEVWPSVGEDEGLLNLWIADRGSLDGNAPSWPWLERTEAIDLYQGVPIGRTLDGRTIIAPVDGASYLVGGRPGQGKSQFVRTLVCGAMFDPRARIRVYVLASNNDFAAMRPRLERYRTGLGRETIAAVLEEMKELYTELERRGEYMEAHGYDTASDAGFEPIVAVFDEIHQAFQHRDKELRTEISAYAEDLAKLARKYGILVIYSTQSADAQSIPKGVTRQSQQRVAYSVVDQPANDGLLGSGSYKRGVTATSLRPGNKKYHGDRGKSVTVGLVPDANWAMCCGFMIPSEVLPELTERALAVHEQAAHQAPLESTQPETRDLLSDVAECLHGDDKVKATDMASRLRDLAPHYTPYKHLSGQGLADQLAEHGVTVPKTSVLTVYAERVHHALADREGGNPQP
ncbi:FtsK/SpoIIIE domain-containing protein, partial [Actinopolyspora mortivallis]